MSSHKQQQGAVLMFMLLILMALSLFAVKVKPEQRSAESDMHSLRALHEAKQLLLSYAARPHGRESDSAAEHRELRLARPGELPCPDADNSGQATFPDFDYVGANCRYRVGWFSWETFDSEELLDGHTAELWYAVADGFFNKSGLGGYNEPTINYQTPVTMSLDGKPVVAVLFASGRPFRDQLQRNVNDAALAQSSFLEHENADANNDAFVSRSTLGDFNDIVIGITLDELLSAVEKQAAIAIAKRLNKYFIDNGTYPPPSTTGALCDLQALPVQGHVPYSCAGVVSASGNLSFPATTAIDAADIWVVRNVWLPLFNYERLAINRMRLSSRTASSQMRAVVFEDALQLRL